MTKVVPFTKDATFKNRLKSHGFCLENPDRRYPTRNPFPSQIISLATRSGLDRKAQLKADRKAHISKDRSRILPWFITGLGWSAWPKDAAAHGHHPPSLPFVEPSKLEVMPLDVPTIWEQALVWIGQIDLALPGWSLAHLSGLLVIQAVGIFQRRALLRASTTRIEATQPDLFPETLADKSDEPDAPYRPWRWQIDAATRQGQIRDENQDALKVLRFSDDIAVLVVCDGAGGISGGREASQSAVAAIAAELSAIWNAEQTLTPHDLEHAITCARQTAEEDKLSGVTTALLVLLHGDMIHTATLGDGAVAVIWPDGMVGPVQVPHHTLGRPSNEIGAYIGGDCQAAPRLSSHRLESGCIVFAMTDGASDLFTFEDFAATRHKYQVTTGIADAVLAHLEAAKDPDSGAWLHSDNMTLAIAQLCEGAYHDATN